MSEQEIDVGDAERAVEEAREVHLTGKVGGLDEATGRPLLRLFEAQTGYDCFESPCGKGQCGKRAGGSHGRHGDEWVYSVTNGLFAVSLRVYTDRLRGVRSEKMRRSDGKGSAGAVLDAHSGVPTSEDQIREGRKGGVCQYIDAGLCFGGFSGYLVADEFFSEHGRDTQDQTEAFWEALEAKWRSLRASIEADLPSVVRCRHCEGAGVTKPVEPLLTDFKAMTLVESARRYVPEMERKVLEALFVRTAEAFMKNRELLAEACRRAEKAENEIDDAQAGERFAKEYGHEVERARTLGLTAGLLRATETCATMSAAALAEHEKKRRESLGVSTQDMLGNGKAARWASEALIEASEAIRALVGPGDASAFDTWVMDVATNAIDRALSEVRRQGGPEYLLTEARNEGLAGARAWMKATFGVVARTGLVGEDGPGLLRDALSFVGSRPDGQTLAAKFRAYLGIP